MIRSHVFGVVATRRSLIGLLISGACALPLLGCNDKLVPAEDTMDGESSAATVRKPVESLNADLKESVIRGGRLYDNWFDVTGVDVPTTANPVGGYIVDDTDKANFLLEDLDKQYRCKTCHGFTFTGEYGFVGVMDASDNKSIAEIEAIIADGITYTIGDVTTTVHDFGYLTVEQVADLANFIKYGVVDINDYIYQLTKAGKGDSFNGETQYTGTAGCSGGGCHDTDGTNIDFADDNPGVNEDEYVGTIGQLEPAEMLHKIRFGDPMENRLTSMPSIYDDRVGLTTQDALDIMTYTQQLPCTLTQVTCP